MEPDRHTIRDDLIATLHAAEELPPDDRGHLADVFLDKLESRYDLVPRSSGRTGQRRNAPTQPWGRPPIPFLWVAIAIMAALFVVLPTVFWLTHVPFMPIIVVLVVIWFFRRRRWGHSSRW